MRLILKTKGHRELPGCTAQETQPRAFFAPFSRLKNAVAGDGKDNGYAYTDYGCSEIF
jgi:hypothetical protein